jgi:FkbM family methyltransferase
MMSKVRRWVRPLTGPCVHAWQWFHDRAVGEWRNLRDRRRALRLATMIVQDVYNIRFVLYAWDRPSLPILLRHPYDVAEFQAIPHLVQAGDLAFDIGANIGIYSVLLSRLCGPTGRVWAFEAVPDTCWRLRETLALNRCDNVTAVQAAVCEKSGTVQMNLFEPQFAEWNTLGAPSMRAPNGTLVSPSQSVDVRSLTLDEFCDTECINRINFLKVDVEGFELSVFMGARRLLQERRVNYICFEISKDPLKGAGVESRKVFEALEAHGYAAYRFDRTTGRFEGPIQDTLESWTNFYASWMDMSTMDRAIESRLAQTGSLSGTMR